MGNSKYVKQSAQAKVLQVSGVVSGNELLASVNDGAEQDTSSSLQPLEICLIHLNMEMLALAQIGNEVFIDSTTTPFFVKNAFDKNLGVIPERYETKIVVGEQVIGIVKKVALDPPEICISVGRH